MVFLINFWPWNPFTIVVTTTKKSTLPVGWRIRDRVTTGLWLFNKYLVHMAATRCGVYRPSFSVAAVLCFRSVPHGCQVIRESQ